MEKNKVIRDVENIILDLFGAVGDKISLEDHLEYDVGLDSLDRVEMVVDFERHFNIEIHDDEISDIHRVNDFVELIMEKVK